MLDSTLASNIMKVWKFDNFYEKSIPTEDLVKMAEFVLKNNYFEQLEQLLVRNLHHHMRVYI